MDTEPSAQTLKDFGNFVEKSKSILGESRNDELLLIEFRAFTDESNRIIVHQVRQALKDPKVKARFKNLSRWLLPPTVDILMRVGICELEDKYTRLITWMLFPPKRPDLALRVQKAWLTALNLSFAAQIEYAAPVDEQVMTKEGRPDIVLSYKKPAHTVIVEAKINTPEHDTPRKEPQTVSYPDSIRRHLKLPPEHEITMVFLTADDQIAKSHDAIPTSYEVLLNSIASELSPSELPFDLRAAYSMIISHVFAFAALRNVEKATRLEAVKHFLLDDPSSLTDEMILEDIGVLGPFTRMIREGD